jgi:formylglycine-generating enzyme required for sulfatase activity
MTSDTKTSHADLLRAFRDAPGERYVRVAELCGFELLDAAARLPAPPVPVAQPARPVPSVAQFAPSSGPEEGGGVFRLLTTVSCKELAAPAMEKGRELAALSPITEAEWGAPQNHPPLPGKTPLMLWTRLWPFLRRALSTKRAGIRLDLPRLVRGLASLHPPRHLPRLPALHWCAESWLLLDRRDALAAFYDDADDLLQLLERMRGRDARPAQRLGTGHPPRDLPPTGTPVLVVSDFGMNGGDARRMGEWVEYARRLQQRGCACFALVPCPRERWDEAVSRNWVCACWDSRERVPPSGMGLRPTPMGGVGEKRADGLTCLAAMMAPALGVQPPLLRALRGLVSSDLTDVGTEYDVLNSPSEFLRDLATVGLPRERLPDRREAFNELSSSRKGKVMDLLSEHHADRSAPLQAKEALVLHECGAPVSAERVTDARLVLRRCCAALRGLLTAPQARGRQTARVRGFDAYIRREITQFCKVAEEEAALAWLAGERLKGTAVANRPAELADVDFRVIRALLEGREGKAARWEFREMGGAFEAVPWHPPAPVDGMQTGRPLALATVRGTMLDLAVATPDEPPTRPEWRLSAANQPLRLAEAHALTVKTNAAEFTCRALVAPPWASRFGWDRFGLYVEFMVGEALFRLRWIPAGVFTMGSPEGELGRYSDEGPRHRVVIGHGFWLGETPVTQGQYLAVLGDNPSHFGKAGADAPVETASWAEVQGCCSRLGRALPELAEEWVCRLPSEAEWEYACRAGTDSGLYSGKELTSEKACPNLADLAWYGENSGKTTHPVKGKLANAWGLYDMLGNVCEWCGDTWHDTYDGAWTDGRAWEGRGRYRVIRGGGWIIPAGIFRCAFRLRLEPEFRDRFLGFRLVLAPSSSQDPDHSLEQQEAVAAGGPAGRRGEPGPERRGGPEAKEIP